MSQIEININLVGFGQLICGKVKPKCGVCPVRSDCDLGQALKDIEDIATEKNRLAATVNKKVVKKG